MSKPVWIVFVAVLAIGAGYYYYTSQQAKLIEMQAESGAKAIADEAAATTEEASVEDAVEIVTDALTNEMVKAAIEAAGLAEGVTTMLKYSLADAQENPEALSAIMISSKLSRNNMN